MFSRPIFLVLVVVGVVEFALVVLPVEAAVATTTLVSINSAGTASGNNDSPPTAISANGRFVLFQSFASDLVANDTNGKADAFVRDLK